MRLFCGVWRQDLKTKLCTHNQKEVESVQVYAKGVLKNDFVDVETPETSDGNLFYQLRSKALIHQREFDLKYILDISLLHITWFL